MNSRAPIASVTNLPKDLSKKWVGEILVTPVLAAELENAPPQFIADLKAYVGKLES